MTTQEKPISASCAGRLVCLFSALLPAFAQSPVPRADSYNWPNANRTRATTDVAEPCRNRVTAGAQQMAGHGDPEIDFCFGLAYDRGDMGWPQDRKRAIGLLSSSAQSGYAAAEMVLAEHYIKGDVIPQDYNRALNLLRHAASQGLAGAENDLGAAYLYGWGVPKNNEEALKWFRLAAVQGDAKAQNNIDMLSSNGRPARVEPAQDLYQEGGRLYGSGQKEASAKPFLAAAQAGNSLAQNQIAWHYLNGVGVPQSAAEAAKWYRRSAEAGNAAGMWNFGLLYENGQGVPENWVEAAKWYQKSAELADPAGQRQLAFAYQYGIGVPQNRQTAIAWHRRAAASKDGQSAYWARWLADPSNNIGFRNNQEQSLYIRSGVVLVYGSITFGDPAGILFHNEPERLAWLEQQGKNIEERALKTACQVNHTNCVVIPRPTQ